jgi:hypothetical protein
MIGLGDWSRRLIEMIDQIDWSRCIRFSIPVGLRTEEYVVKPTSSVASHIDVNHAVCHFEVPQGGDVVFEREAASAQVIGDFRIRPELPSWRIDWKGFSLRCSEANEKCCSNTAPLIV